MPDLSALLSTLKSPKTALAVFLFSAALIFAPFDSIGVKRPAFTNEYEGFIAVVLLLSAAILSVEILSATWRIAKHPYYKWKRKRQVAEIFLSLNLEELCVLWSMTQSGIKTIKGSSSNYLMLSLRQKGCLYLISGIQTANQLHHVMHDDIFKIVAEKGFDRIPDDFKNSARFQDEVQNILSAATNRWS